MASETEQLREEVRKLKQKVAMLEEDSKEMEILHKKVILTDIVLRTISEHVCVIQPTGNANADGTTSAYARGYC